MDVSLPALSADECKLLAGYIYSVCGIQLDQSKHYLIESRLRELVAETNVGTYSELYNRARSDSTGSLQRAIVDAMTTGETLFFRDSAPFELLRDKLLPELIERRSASAGGRIPIRIWSAAASTGQELYSIAIVLREFLGAAQKFELRLLGTDVSARAIERAKAGVYKDVEIERGMRPDLLARYFSRTASGWEIRPEIRAMTSFRTLNLLSDFGYLGQFDIIFCRNVAIYFSELDKAALFGRLAKALAPDGSLIVGATESLNGVAAAFELKRHLRSVYYQRSAALAALSPPARCSPGTKNELTNS